MLISLIYFDLDLIVEGYSRMPTREIRGLYLTSANIAWVIAPTLAAFLLVGDEYWRVYCYWPRFHPRSYLRLAAGTV